MEMPKRTIRYKFTKDIKEEPKETPEQAAKRLAKELRPPIPDDELVEQIEKMAPIWKKMADRKGCPYCQKKRKEGKIPRWKAWVCPVKWCRTKWFLIPSDVKDIDDLM